MVADRGGLSSGRLTWDSRLDALALAAAARAVGLREIARAMFVRRSHHFLLDRPRRTADRAPMPRPLQHQRVRPDRLPQCGVHVHVVKGSGMPFNNVPQTGD